MDTSREPRWAPNYLRGATHGAQWAREWMEETSPESRVWEELTPEVREYWVREVDAAMEELQRVRRLLARERHICVGCGVTFVGRPDAKYHSAACKQGAYRRRQRDG